MRIGFFPCTIGCVLFHFNSLKPKRAPRARRLPAVAWLALFALGPASCRQIVGIEERSATSFAYASEVCALCSESCSQASSACASDAACALLGQCIAGLLPNDVAGRAKCEASHSFAASSDAYGAFDRCLRAACTEPCYGTRGLFAGLGEECDACLSAPNHCQDAFTLCAADGACERAYHRCFGDPATVNPADAFRCYFGSSDGAQATDAVEACSHSCVPACPFGRSWECVGNYDWVTPESDRVLVSYPAVEVTGAPAVGATFTACEVPLVPCSPVASTQVDANGLATLEIPFAAGLGGYRGYTVVSGATNGQPVFPEVLFFGHPLARDERSRDSKNSGLPVATEAAAAGMAGVFDVQLDPSLGFIAVFFMDCSARSASGVTLDISASAKVDNPGAPSQSTRIAYYGGLSVTASLGLAYGFNVRPGCIEVTGSTQDSSTNPTHRATLEAFPGTMSVIWVEPLTRTGESVYTCTPK